MSIDSSGTLPGHFGREYKTLVRGEGVFVFDEEGTRYLDAIGGVGVVNIGHGVKEVAQAISEQAATLAYSYGGVVDNKPRQKLAKKLQHWAPPGMGDVRVFFCSGGAEANEAALKLAYQYHWERGHPTKRKVIGRWQSYHGNTIGTLSMGGRTSWRRMHDGLLLDFPHIPPPYCLRCPWGSTYPTCGIQCAKELRRAIEQAGPENVAAFIAEPVIGTSMSAVVPPEEYYPLVREICDEFDVLLIADEVMSGVGRTGKKWGIDHWDVTPDIITTAKGISGGYAPLAATIFAEKVWQAIANGSKSVMHSYTFGGNPLSCAAGVAVMQYIEDHQLVDRAASMGQELFRQLLELKDELPYVVDVRGRGLFLGLELATDSETMEPFPPEWNVGEKIEDQAMENGLMVLAGVHGLIDGVAGDHLELVPPYTIESEHVSMMVEILHKSITDVVDRLPSKRV